MLGAWQWAEWRPKVELIAKEWTAKLGLVAAGLGVTLVPGLAADAVRPDVALIRIRSDRPASRTVLLARRATDEPPHARAFAELLHEVASELTSELQRRSRYALMIRTASRPAFFAPSIATQPTGTPGGI